MALNVRTLIASEAAGIVWFVTVSVIGLIARRDRPFGNADKVRRAWRLLLAAEIVGGIAGMVSLIYAWRSYPNAPAFLQAGQLVFAIVFQTALFSWASTFPVFRLIVRRVSRRKPKPPAPVGR
jgi:hypothetical protein